MAVAVAVAVSGGVAVPVAGPVAGLTKRFFNHIQKDFLINVWGYIDLLATRFTLRQVVLEVFRGHVVGIALFRISWEPFW